MQPSVRLSGYALHAGVVTSVALTRCDGPFAFEQSGLHIALSDLRVTRTDLGVSVAHASGLCVDLVEHLLAALGGLSLGDGVTMEVDGPELPLLDGGARTYAEALMTLGIPPASRSLAVTRCETLRYRDSAYHFEPGSAVALDVTVDFEHPAIGFQRARWDGSPAAFLREIAPARTFGFRAHAESLWRRGRARLSAHEDGLAAFEQAVIVFADDASSGGAAGGAANNEVARHKLLDLVGDLTFYGGPPLGCVTAERPGHGATHDIVPRALASGLLSAT